MRSRSTAILMLLALVGSCVLSLATTRVSAEAPTPIPTEAVHSGPVPERYRALYDALKAKLEAANAGLDRLSAAGPTPLTFAADLLTANGNRGEALLTPDALAGTHLYLDRLQALGVQGVKVSITYPLLTPDFPRSAAYLTFYKQVAQDVRGHGIKLAVESGIIFTGTVFSDVKVDFSRLTFDRFKASYRTMAQTILAELRPDYFVVLNEPDTQANLSGLKELRDPDTCLEFVQSVLNGLDKGQALLGAGSGSWSPLTFAEKFVGVSALDVIDIHIYPIDGEMVRNAVDMAVLAHKHNKRAMISEAWLYKTAQVGGGNNVAASEGVFRLDMYRFWQPLDQAFMSLMAKLAKAAHVEFVSFFWSTYLFSYVSYEPRLENLPFATVRDMLNRAAAANLVKGVYSSTGAFYQQLIASYRSQ